MSMVEPIEQTQDPATTEASDSLREADAILGQKMSNKVRVQRWPGEYTVVGPPIMVLDLEYVATSLASSGFMLPWIVEQIKAHLLGGGVFMNRSKAPTDDEPALVSNGQYMYVKVRSEYRMATEKEVLDYVDTAQFSDITGHKISRRAQEKAYVLHYHEGVELIKLYDKLPRQAKVILDLLHRTGRENFTEASIEVILTESREELKTKQDPMRIFGFYRRPLIDEGHLEEQD
jgi:hypothetical protein